MKKLLIFASAFAFAFSLQSFNSNITSTAAGSCTGSGTCIITYPDGKVVESTGSWSEEGVE